MHNEQYLLGIDIGTQGCKSGIFDINGNLISSVYTEYKLVTPRPGWAEQDPDWWWNAVVKNIRSLLKSSNILPDNIVGIGICGQMHATVPISRDGELLSRSVLLWCDKRSAPQCEKIRKKVDEKELIKITGNLVSPSWIGPHIMWVKENTPNIYEKAYKFLTSEGYVIYKLTNKFSIDWSEASGTYLFDIRKKTWSEELAQILGIDLDKLPDIYPSYEVVGEVTEEAAKITGLKPGTPVVAGAGDFMCTLMGAGIVTEGRAADIAGTACIVATYTKEPIITPKLMNLHHAIPGWIPFGITEGGGELLRWFRNNIAIPEVQEAKKRGVSPYQVIDEKAAEVEPGAGGLITYPYPLGERPPGNVNSRVVLFGLLLSHGRAHIARSILEGIAFVHREIADTMEEHGVKIEMFRAIGGGSKSKIWRQIKADVYGKPVALLNVTEGGILGAAVLAGVGIGIFKDPVKTIDEFVKIVEIAQPNKENHELYNKLYQVYRKFRKTFWSLFDELAEIYKVKE